MASTLNNNTEVLQELLSKINALPDESNGVELPPLDNEGTAFDLLAGKELINSSGEKVTGTIETKTSSDLTVSGATVTVPKGYYASQATKSIATATQATPSVSIDSAGKITATATQTAGYVSAGTKTGTKQLTVQAAKTITPTTSNQTAVASGRYTTGAITVKGDANLKADNITQGISIFGVAGANPYEKNATDAEIAAQETALVEITEILQTKAIGTPLKLQSKTVTPSTSSQIVKPDEGCDGLAQVVVNGYTLQNKTVIPSDSTQVITPDTHYNGLAQVTVNGDANLVAENIAEGVNIFGVTGTYAGGGSGGAVEICTVTIKPIGGSVTNLCYTTVDENGKIISCNDGVVSPSGKEIICVCGTIVTFGMSMLISINVENAEILSQISGGITSLAIKITAESGGISTIKPMADMGT